MSYGTGWATEADYAWADERDAFCVSFVEATSPEEVLEKMVRGCGTGILSVAEAREWVSRQTVSLYGSAIEAGIVGRWVVTFEATPYQATLPEVLRISRMSKGSRAIVVLRRFDGGARFLYAVDGIVIRSFDPLCYDDPTCGDGPPLPEEAGLHFGSGHPMASALACAERLSHIRLTSDVLDHRSDWLAIGHHPLHSLTSADFCAADDVDGARQAAVSSPGELGPADVIRMIIGAIVLPFAVVDLGAWLADGAFWSNRSNAVQAVVVAPETGTSGTTVELSGGPCPPVPDGQRSTGIYFGLHDLRAEAGKDFPAMGGVPMIPGKPWKGWLRIPDGISAGRYTVYAGCFATEAEGIEGFPFYKYDNSAFEVGEP